MLPVHCDVTKEDDIEAMVQAAVDEFGRLDVMLNVAGIADGARITDITQEQLRAAPCGSTSTACCSA